MLQFSIELQEMMRQRRTMPKLKVDLQELMLQGPAVGITLQFSNGLRIGCRGPVQYHCRGLIERLVVKFRMTPSRGLDCL
jgi:hypothetical protein